MKQTIEESELLHLLASDDTKRQAFSWIMKTHQQKIYYHIRKMLINHDDTNDVLQNAFLKAWLHIGSFRGESSISTWLYRIATNETLDYLRTKKHTNEQVDIEDSLALSLQDSSYFSCNEIERKLQQAILQLPEKQRLVFNMKYFDDITYEQMSEILDTSVGALKASYHLASKKIEKLILEID
jgi:RNA polymerase sigma-70 factor, ECF subfamily